MNSVESLNISQKLNRNILGSAFFKGIDVLLNFLLVRYAIYFFGEEDYGIWLTILSVFTWFSVIEFGISSSFRNEITKYVANGNFKAVKLKISQAYKASFLLYSLTILIGVFILFFTYIYYETKVSFITTLLLSFVFYMLYYIVFFLQTVLLSIHQPDKTYFLTALQKGVLLIGVFISIWYQIEPSLLLICVWFTGVPLLVWTLSSFILYRTTLSAYAPNYNIIKSVKIRHSVTKMKWPFFIIQICTLLIYSTDNLIIISQMEGEDVTNYNIAFKYFNLLIVLFNVVLLPFWSSFGEAMHQKKYDWVIKQVNKLVVVLLLLLVLGLIMLLVSNWFYQLWIDESIEVSLLLSTFMLISMVLTSWNNIFAYFLNSISETKTQTQAVILSALINIPLSFILINYLGLPGVVLATCIALLPMAFSLPWQYSFIIKRLKND